MYMWPDLWKPDIIVQFSNSSLLNIYNLPSQMYSQAKFQPDMPIIFGVMALQRGNNKKIYLYSKHWENKLQALTKTDVTYEWNITGSCNLHHRVYHEQCHCTNTTIDCDIQCLLGPLPTLRSYWHSDILKGIYYWVSFFPISSSFTMYRDKICEEKSIMYDSFNIT